MPHLDEPEEEGEELTIARPRRSLLYIPGSSQKMLSKGIASGADTICLDIEDGVAASAKGLARKQIKAWLDTEMTKAPENMEICVRINAVSAGDVYNEDIEWLDTLDVVPHSIALPKMDSVHDFNTFLPILTKLEKKHKKNIELIGMIESPLAVINLPSILQESKSADNNHHHLSALIFGGDDYSAASGCIRTETNHELDFPRAMVQMHASAHGIGVLDIVCKEFKDPSRFKKESLISAQQGYIGRQCIHPSQIQHANDIYQPSNELFEWSSGVLAEFDTQTKAGVGAFTYHDAMIDMPTIKRAENILIRAKACGMVLKGDINGNGDGKQ
jgi:citrate lyase subunit beta-like protein